MATVIFNSDRKGGLSGANKAARVELRKRWDVGKLGIVSGKALLARLSTWVHEEFEVSIGAATLARAFKANDIPPEVHTVLNCIREGTAFASQRR